MRNQNDLGSVAISPTYNLDSLGRVLHQVYRQEFDSQYRSFLPHGEGELKDKLVIASSPILQDHAERIDLNGRFYVQENSMPGFLPTIGQQTVSSAVRIAYDELVTLSNNIYIAKSMDGKDQLRSFR